jgi:biopolymer transport protein ExbB/TolQ
MAHDFTLMQVMLKGGWTVGLLILMSIVVFAILYDRWSFFRKNFKQREEVMPGLEPLLNRRNAKECLEACDRNGSFLARIVRAGIKAHSDGSDLKESMEREAKSLILRFETRLPLLATIGSTAPFIGLFGTVLGIIRAFRDLAISNAGGAAVVSQGIAEALICTAVGLFVAITAVFIFNLFQARVNRMAQEAEIVIFDVNQRFGN